MLGLYLRDAGVRRVLREHPALAGKRAFARGAYSAVFEGSRPDTVLKLTIDPASYCYLTDYCAPQGRYKPNVVEDYCDVGETIQGCAIYLLEVERLQPLRRGTHAARMARRVVDWYYRNGARYLPDEMGQVKEMDQKLANFLEQLNVFILNYSNTGMRFDAKVSGFLAREDGTMVASDPVFTPHIMNRSRKDQQVPR